MEEVKQHRLHIGGIAATVTEKDLVNRFSSFGKVVEGSVNGLGLDANGAPKKFAFLTLEATEPSMKKCLSLLSGSVWKGVKLRIAPAKPDFQSRLSSSTSSSDSAPKSKKRKRSSDPSIGHQSPFFELVDTTNFARHRGWAIDNSAIASSSQPSVIFPLIIRPSHPLPDVPKAATTSWTREAPKAKAKLSKEARAAARSGISAGPPTVARAYRMRIDVRRWGRKKIIYETKDEEEDTGFGKLRGHWEVADEEEDSVEETKEKDGKEEVKWVFKTPDGKVRRTEIVRLTQRSVAHTDRFTSLLEGLNRPAQVANPTPAPEPLPFFFDAPETDLQETATDSTPLPKRQRSLSPPRYIPSAPRTLLFNEEDTFALITSTQEASEIELARLKERKKQLDVLKGLLGEVDEDQEEEEEMKGPKVEGYGDGDSEDDEEFMSLFSSKKGGGGEKSVAMQMRGGAAPMEGESDSDEEEGSDDSDEEEEEEEEEEVKGKVSKSQLNSLKDMFKPQETTSSFSLLSGMALDIDPLDLERSPSPPLESFPIASAPVAAPTPSFRPQHQHQNFAPPPALGRAKRAWIGTGAVTPFFPIPTAEEVEEMGLGESLDEKVLEERRKEYAGNENLAKSFFKSQTTEEIEADHQKLRDSLRGLARKRHREASKKGKGKKGFGAKRE